MPCRFPRVDARYPVGVGRSVTHDRGFFKCCSSGGAERESIGAFGCQRFGSRIDDRVREATSLANKGNGTIAQAIKLIQAARFKMTWHQKQVRTGLDLMSRRFGKFQADRDFLWVVSAKVF